MRFTLLPVCALMSVPLFLVGCGIETSSNNASFDAAPMVGSIHGGQQPVAGSRVYLMSASTAGYGSSSNSVMTTGSGSDSNGTYVLSDGNGNFSLTGKYVCTPSTLIYALALGGQPIAGSPANSAIGLMTAVGTCPASGTFATSVPYLQINEVTTVAAAYALSGFMTSPTALASSGTALAQTGMNNAFATATSLANFGSGSANASVGTNGTAPQAKVNLLANILAACVNSAGGSSTACSTLFSNATSGTAGSTAPTDTATAALNIAHNPGANVAALFGLATASAPFQPMTTTTPNDLALTIQYTTPNLSTPVNVRADASGNIWFRDSAGNFVVEKLGPTGAVLSGNSGFAIGGQNAGNSLALDAQGNAFVANRSSFSIYKLSPDGMMLSSGAGFTGTCSDPNAKVYAVAIDGSGNALGSGSGGCVLKVSNSGAVLSGVNGFPSTSDDSTGLAVDSTNVTWIVGSYGNQVRRISSTGSVIQDYGSAVSGPLGIALDSANSAWIPNHFYDTVTHLLADGTVMMFSAGGVHAPNAVAIDGANSVWVANNLPTISAFSNAGVAKSTANGYAAATSGIVRSLTVDGSGNVWTAVNSPDAIVEFIGAATPAARPILPNQQGVRP